MKTGDFSKTGLIGVGARSQGGVSSSLSRCPHPPGQALAPCPQVSKEHRILLGPVGIHSSFSSE